MQGVVGWAAPPLNRPAPATHLYRQLNPNSLLCRVSILAINPRLTNRRRSIASLSDTFSCRCSGSSSSNSTASSSDQYADWDWPRWSRHFSEIDQAESFVSVLKFELEEAIEKEDFLEAAKLKKSIAESSSKDIVTEVVSQLKAAIEEQRYSDASRLSRHAGTGLIGWWVGHSKDSSDSYGRIVRITPEVGKYVAKSYSPRQLLSKSTGTPLFEIFLVKDNDGTYTMKVVSLKISRKEEPTKAKDENNLAEVKDENTLAVEEDENTLDEEIDQNTLAEEEDEDALAAEKDENTLAEEKSASERRKKPNKDEEELLKSLLSLFKKIPDFKVSSDTFLQEEEEESKVDTDSVQQLMHENDEDAEEDENDEEQEDEIKNTDRDADEIESESDKAKLYVGGVLHKKEDPSAIYYERVAAEVSAIDKDSFLLCIPQNERNILGDKIKGTGVTMGDLIADVASDLMPAELARSLLGTQTGLLSKAKKAKDLQRVYNAIRELSSGFFNRLSRETVFNRIVTDSDNLDPFTGIYVGSFGTHGPEVVQLRRRYGQWEGSNGDLQSGLEFYEYVEAVKLTGDLNVPAGQVTFRAKIGEGHGDLNDGFFPDGLGVKSFYGGQGRIAKKGYKNPQWVDGELLVLDGKGGMGPIKGADLGFIYLKPEQSFLVLFNRLHLPQ